MSMKPQKGDLVQVRLNAGASTFIDVRSVLDVMFNGDLMVMGGPEGRRVPKRDVLCVIPPKEPCDGCFCRPCECYPDDDRVL